VVLPDGTRAIKRIPGNLKFNDITLKRGVVADRTLWDWRQQVVAGKFEDARCNGTIQMLDSTSTAVATYAFENGWVRKYTLARMTTGKDESAVEEITIAIESFTRQ
jgi:phage tail-like protein